MRRHSPRASFAVITAAALLAGCEPEQPPKAPTPPTVTPPPSAAAPAPLPSAVPSASPAATPYSGHGLSSISPEILAKFAPTPIASDVSRHIQAMLDVRVPGAGRLSPDGKTLYFSWTITGTRQVFRLDGPDRFPVQMTGGEDSTTLVDITPDGRRLIFSRDRKGEENPGLYLQDPKGGPLEVIQHKPKVQTELQFVTDDSKALYYRANDVTVESYAIYRYDIEKKQREVVFDQPGIWSASDFRPSGALLLAKEVGGNMTEYYEWDPAKKVLKPLFGQGEREDYRAVYGAGDGEVIVQTPHFSEFHRLYQWKGGKFTPISPDIKFDINEFSIDEKKQRILYTVNEGGYTRLKGMDAKSFKDIKLPAFPPADHVIPASTTRSGAFSTFAVDTGKGLPTSYSVDWKSLKLTQWDTASAPEIDVTRFARATLESYPARDGTPIPMFVRRPASCDKASHGGGTSFIKPRTPSEPCPVVVSFHGGPEGQTKPGFSVRAQMFVDAGFIYVEPNVRGSDGYGKKWLHADDGPKRLAVITDIEDCAKYIRKNWGDGGKEPKIGVTGGSYGGYSTLAAMTLFAGAYDAGVEIVGFSSLLTFLMNTAPYRRPLRISEYGDPEKDKEALISLSPINSIDKVKGPLLMLQGANDPRVPVGEAVQFYQQLEARKLPAKLMIFADEGHGFAKRENQVISLGHTVRFFQEHLQGKKPE